MIRTAYGLLVVLHHHERVVVSGELGEGLEQDLVVARMQPDGGLIEHVAHALQVRAELRGEADALRFPARERGRSTVELQVAEPDTLEELQPCTNFREQIAGDLALARAETQPREKLRAGADGLAGEGGDRALAKAHGERGGVEALT